MKSREEILSIIDSMIGPQRHVYYRLEGGDPESGFSNCEDWFRYLFRLREIEIAADLHEVRKDFKLVEGPAQFMDAVVFRGDIAERRHVGIMLDARWFTHCNEDTNGVARDDITRPEWKFALSHMARHKAFL
jgi:hypothetical protein